MGAIKQFLAERVPAAFKDARLTLESVLGRSSLDADIAQAAAYAVAVSVSARELADALKAGLASARCEQAEVAAAIMGMTNVYYSFLEAAALPGVKALPAQLRMVSYGQQAAADKLGFEVAALAVSIAGKCRPCIASHVAELQTLGFTDEQFRDLARIAAAVNAVARVA